MELLYTRRFLRSLKKLPEDVQRDALTAVERFRTTRAHQSLRLHKLSGRLKKYHAFSVNFSYRIIVEMTKEAVYFMDIGDHDIYS